MSKSLIRLIFYCPACQHCRCPYRWFMIFTSAAVILLGALSCSTRPVNLTPIRQTLAPPPLTEEQIAVSQEGRYYLPITDTNDIWYMIDMKTNWEVTLVFPVGIVVSNYLWFVESTTNLAKPNWKTHTNITWDADGAHVHNSWLPVEFFRGVGIPLQ